MTVVTGTDGFEKNTKQRTNNYSHQSTRQLLDRLPLPQLQTRKYHRSETKADSLAKVN